MSVKEEFGNVTVVCDVTNRMMGVKYQTARKNYTCWVCLKRILKKEDYYYATIDTTLIPRDNEFILGKLTVFTNHKSVKRRYHTECFPAREEHTHLEVRKAKQHFDKL